MRREWQPHANELARAIRALCRQKGVRGGRILRARAGARHVSVPVRLANPADRSVVQGLVGDVSLACGQRNLAVVQEGNTLVFQAQLPEAVWQTYTRQNLTAVDGPVAVGVGLSDRKEVVSIDLGTSPHVAIIGSSQVSGKSTTLLSFLVGLMEKLSPGELQVLLVDPAGDCADKLTNAAHLVMPPATTAAQAAVVIDRAMDEKEKRERERVRAGSGSPMFVLVVDEAQSIVPKADRQGVLATLGETVAKLDMHLVVATQKPLEETLPGLMFNLSTRLVGYVPTGREAALLTGLSSDDAPAHRLTQRGEFLHIRSGHVSRFTVAIATDEDVARLPVNGELRWPDLTPAVEKEPNKGGRPAVQLEGRAVGHYLMATLNGNSISEKVARENLGLKYTGHRLNRDFAAEVLETMETLGYER